METQTETRTDVQSEPQPLLTDREVAEFRHSRRVRRVIGLCITAAIVLVVATFGPAVVRHVDAAAKFTLVGGDVDWSITAANWRDGGATSVDLGPAADIVSDASLTRLRDLHNIVSLDLSECEEISDSGLAALKDLHGLKELHLTRTRILRQILKTEPRKKFTDEALVHLQTMTQLTSLSLSGNPITDDGLARLSGLTNLQVLQLDGTHVTDKGLKHLLGMKKLKTLVLSDANVTKQGVAQFEKTMGGIDGIFLSGYEAPEPN